MNEIKKRQRKSAKTRQTEAEPMEAAFGPLAREFVRLIRDHESPAAAEHAAAMELAEWLYQHRLTDAERGQFVMDTGWLFGCELPPGDPLRLGPDGEPPATRHPDDVPL